ncbi:MAG: zinc ribbon domain-containing protein [Nitrososphaerales archaeon]
MYCAKCGAQNQDDATYCSSCGAPLTPVSASTPAAAPSQMQAQGGKNGLVAAILNLFWGIGYLYLGYKKVLGIPAFGFVILMILVYVILGIFTVGIIPLILAIAMAYDGYQKASGKKGFIGAER